MGKAQYRVVGDAAVCSILFKGMLVEFVVDVADLERVKQHRWHYSSNSYIATSQKIDASGNKKRELYLHTFLLSPNATQTVYHINKNGLDNRRANLRMIDSAVAAAIGATAKKKRSIELPPTCGLKPEDIPKHVWYVQANGYHRDRFAIELKTEGILWKTTSSKKVSLQEKLQHAKVKLEELYEQYPHLDPTREEEQIAALNASLDTILKGSVPPVPTPI
jgi:hypothetical protein